MSQNINQQNHLLPKIGITLGDPGGIGPEITAKALSHESIRTLAQFVLIGDKSVYENYSHHDFDELSFHDQKLIGDFHFPSNLSIPHRGRAAYTYLETAIHLIKNNTIDGLVTAPVNKQAIIASGISNFTGHTEMLANAFNAKQVEMMFVGGPYKTIIATRHIPLKKVPDAFTTKSLLETISLSHHCLVNTFNMKHPRIAICGVNPHAGEGGKLGDEEVTTILPAVQQSQRNGINVSGPFAADTLFIPFNAQEYDLIIAMYHDQGLAPIKAMYFTQLVNFTIGLPFIRTSTAHGTAENIVGKSMADPASMIESIKLACKLTPNKKL